MTKKLFHPKPIPSSEITPEELYLNRRQFMKLAGVVGAGAILAACTGQGGLSPSEATAIATEEAGLQTTATTDELNDPITDYEAISHYNNYYEFTTDKEGVAKLAANFPTRPWDVQVYGLVNNPQTYAIEDILKKFPRQERVYRLRCVEGWSMVIPWLGFPLADLLNEAEPTSQAKFVRLETITAPDEMPGESSKFYPWPYQEGLRLDEAMHDLTILATGLYGKEMPAQNGAPLRLVVPWKYGFKSIKGIVKIELVDSQPATFWETIAPDEYGFYSNVNPERPHPRWSQTSERRIGESGRRATLKFNGYEQEVASLYTGMDLINQYY